MSVILPRNNALAASLNGFSGNTATSNAPSSVTNGKETSNNVGDYSTNKTHGTLNIYIGSNYIAPSTIDAVEKTCQCQLFQNYFNDNGEMLAKIVAGASGYNNIIATSYAVKELVANNKLATIDLNKIPNWHNLDRNFLDQNYDKGNHYSLPYAYTPVFLAYNKDKLAGLGITPNSWAVVFEPKYLRLLKGHVTMFNSMRNVFASALLYLGKDPNSENKNDLKQARALIERAKGYWAKFDSDSYYRALLRGDIWLSMAYSIDLYKTINDAKSSHLDIHLAGMLQKEGNMYELDNIVIPTASPNYAYSYAFANTVLSVNNQYALAMQTGASIVAPQAIKMLSTNIRNIDWLYPPHMQRMHTFNAYQPTTRILASEMWTELQMSCDVATDSN